MATPEKTKRVRALDRLATLYGAVEQMHSIALRQATAAVTEAETALNTERSLVDSAQHAGRAALTAGNSAEWMLARAQTEIASWRSSRIEPLLHARATLRETVRAEFLASRVKTQQMKQVVVNLKEEIDIEQARLVQSASDDRFLTRLRWREAKPARG